MQALAYRGHSVHVEERNVIESPQPLFEADVVHFCRSCFGPMERLARQLKEAGVAIVWDNDEDFLAVPKDSPGHIDVKGMHGQRIWSSLKSMMRIADVVTTPSEALAERYRAVSGADVRVLENYLPPTFTRPDRMPVRTDITVGWHALPGHQSDFDRLGLRETFEHLLRRHHTLRVIGIGADLGLSSHRYEHCEGGVIYAALPEQLLRLDVGIAPLVDSPYNRARSNVKLKEYAAMGVPWLASPVGPYAEMGEDKGGHLVADGGWHEEIDRLVLEADERSVLGRRARRWAQGERIEDHVDQWERTFEDAIERTRARAAR
jgi:glycosyltransferase involved in cell wall biosynthesis